MIRSERRDSSGAPWTVVSPNGKLHVLATLKDVVVDELVRSTPELTNWRNFDALLGIQAFGRGRDDTVYDSACVKGWRVLDKLQFFVHELTGERVPVVGDMKDFYSSFLPRVVGGKADNPALT